jgi:PAS domain S-box-containing protein
METFAANAELPNRDKTLFRLIDANIIGVATCDADSRILEANDAYLEMLGYSRDDLTSERIGWRQLTPPEWEDVSMKAVAEIQATGRCEAFEKEYFRKDGTRVPILMASAAIDESQRQIVAFVLDLTARKRPRKRSAEARHTSPRHNGSRTNAKPRSRASVLVWRERFTIRLPKPWR